MKFYETYAEEEKGIYYGGIVEPEIDNLVIDVIDGERYDLEKDEFIKNGKQEIHIFGSKKAIRELGEYLIALTEYETSDPSYHDHFDDILNSHGEKKVDVIIYKPK